MRLTAGRALGAAAVAAALGQWEPGLTSLAPLRRRALPRLSGIGGGPGIALSYDDGPDPASTPRFLELLDRHSVSATFFLLGSFVGPNAGLVAEMAAAGHEIAVHGWDHRCLAWKLPGTVVDELRRTRDALEEITGRPVRWHRPAYGVLTGDGLVAARRAGLQPVLWSAWGLDWSAVATPRSIADRVARTIRPGGTVLLHDTDRTAAPGSWRRTLGASELLLEEWAAQGLAVGRVVDVLGTGTGDIDGGRRPAGAH